MDASICSEVLSVLEIGGDREKDRKEQEWLDRELGLRFDPFRHLDAGADPQLPAYLIDHGAFLDLWGDWPSFLFAPAGGGKSAFRVRLARACRVEQDGRLVFTIMFCPPRPTAEGEYPEKSAYFEALLQQIGAALLLQLAYKPDRFLRLSAATRKEVRCIFERDFPGSLDYYLDQLEDMGSLIPLAQAFDQTAMGLPAEPSAERIRVLCAAIRETPFECSGPSAPQKRLHWITERLKNLGYESIYLLVDGVDAYVQNPSFAARLLYPLLDRLRAWADQAFFVKFFLPEELEPILKKTHQTILTKPSRIIIIRWDKGLLARVIQERLYAASEGMYDSLEAISTRDTGGHLEEHLAEIVYPQLPREMLRLTQRVFHEHVQRVGPYGRLENQDFIAAQGWYEKQRASR